MKLDNYKKHLESFETVSEYAINISEQMKGQQNSLRNYHGCIVFSELCDILDSVLNSLPYSKFYTTKNNHIIWDFSSVAKLTHSVMETYNIFYYIAIENIQTDEINFRINLFKYYSECERNINLNNLNRSHGVELSIMHKSERLKSEFKVKLEKDCFFKNQLSEECQKEMINGKSPAYISNIEITRRSGITQTFFENACNFCLNNTSTSGFSNPQTEKMANRFIYLLKYLIAYTSISIRDANKIWNVPNNKLPDNILKLILSSEAAMQKYKYNYIIDQMN